MRLKPQIDEARGWISLQPSLCPVFTKPSLLSAMRKVRRKIMLGSAPPSPQVETSALSSHRAPPSFNNECAVAANSQPSNNTRDGWPWCAKCKKTSCTLDTRRRIHGKPENWRPSRKGRANVANAEPSVSDQQPFSKEQVDVLHKLLGLEVSHINVPFLQLYYLNAFYPILGL